MRASPASAGIRALAGLALPLLVAASTGCGTISLAEERELGEQVSRQVESEVTLLRDPQVAGYVERLGRQLVTAAGPQPLPYRFAVVQDASLNAFAVPGGHVYVHTGTLLASSDMSELAGVMAHEVGHVALRHVARSYNRQRNTGVLYQLGSLALSIFVGGSAAAGGQLLGGVAAQAYLTRYSREAEEEADRFAVAVLPRAGIDPQGLVRFFEKLRAQGGAGGPGFLSSHPATPDRIAATSAAIAAARLPAGLRRADGELVVVQRRVRALGGSARSPRAGPVGAEPL